VKKLEDFAENMDDFEKEDSALVIKKYWRGYIGRK
jgi:hypothetical protein